MNDAAIALKKKNDFAGRARGVMDERGHLLDLIYETVLEPGLWVTVMERMADRLGGNSGWLSRINVENGDGSGLLARIDPAMPQVYLDHYAKLNFFAIHPRRPGQLSVWQPGITTERDYLPEDDLARNEYFQDFMLPQDVSSVLVIDVAARGANVCSVNLHRGEKHDRFGPKEIDFARTLHPHLVRAFRLGGLFSEVRELGSIRAAALDRLGQGVVIVDARSRIRHANMVAERLLSARNGIGAIDGRLIATEAAAGRKLEALIGVATAANSDVRCGGSLTAPSVGGGPLSVTVAPLHADGLPMFTSGPAALVTIADTQTDEAAMGAKLIASFALTAAEVRVALALLGGATPKRAAQKFDVSVNTIRSQMANIFGKTGTANQAELSRLMLRLANQP